jgi:hypothetical protein
MGHLATPYLRVRFQTGEKEGKAAGIDLALFTSLHGSMLFGKGPILMQCKNASPVLSTQTNHVSDLCFHG